MCICESVWEVRMFVGACTYGSQKLTSTTALITLCLIDLRQGLLLNHTLVDRASLAGSKPQGSSWVCISSSGIVVIHCHNWLLCQYCPLQSGPHTCAASTLPTHMSHHTWQSYQFRGNIFISFFTYRENLVKLQLK